MSTAIILAATILNAVNGAFAPDGRHVAFQRHNGHDFDLGVFDLTTEEVEWVERGPAQSAYPAWSKDGALAYVQCDYDETAFAAKQTKSQKGCNIRIRENGKVRQITWGREFDSTPSFSPDGKTVYFASARATRMYGSGNLWRVDAAGRTSPVCVRQVARPEGHSFGASQPCVSPDGCHLLWAEFSSLREPWHLMVCDVGMKKSALRLTPDTEYAYAPCWNPKVPAYIAYTCYREGDPGWCVYLMHVKSGATKRLCPGKNPCFSPDGKSILFDDDRDITIRKLTRADFPEPRSVETAPDACDEPEKVLFALENPAEGATGPVPALPSLGTNVTVFLRAEFDWNGDRSVVEPVVDFNSPKTCHALELYFGKGIPWFSTRNPQLTFEGVRGFGSPSQAGRHVMTGVRVGDTLYLSVDDAPPLRQAVSNGLLPIDEPLVYSIGKVGKVRRVELGTGWPGNVPPLATFRRLFAKSPADEVEPIRPDYDKPNYDESKVAPYELEDPCAFADGTKLRSKDEWPKRRREILDIFAKEMYGAEPPPPEALVTECVDRKDGACAGFAVREQWKMWFRKDRSGPCVNWLVIRPRHAKGPVPVISFLNYRGNAELLTDRDIPLTTAWCHDSPLTKDNHALEASRGWYCDPNSDTVLPIGTILARGYAVMSACYGEVSPDPLFDEKDPAHRQDPFAYTGVFDLWGPRDPNRTDDITALGAWAWALSRGLDLAERIPALDAKRSVVTGCSRLGKAAFIAAARDERFAVCVPNQCGGGGVCLAKRDFGECVGTELWEFSHWYCKAYAKYAKNPAKLLTFDQHLLLAAIAPRRVLVEGYAPNDWMDTKGEYLACRAASAAWTFLGCPGLPGDRYPDAYDTSCIGSHLGYVRRTEQHGISAYDWTWLLDFADGAFK